VRDWTAGDMGGDLVSHPSLGGKTVFFLHRADRDNPGEKEPVFPIPQEVDPYGGCPKAPPIYRGERIDETRQNPRFLPS